MCCLLTVSRKEHTKKLQLSKRFRFPAYRYDLAFFLDHGTFDDRRFFHHERNGAFIVLHRAFLFVRELLPRGAGAVDERLFGVLGHPKRQFFARNALFFIVVKCVGKLVLFQGGYCFFDGVAVGYSVDGQHKRNESIGELGRKVENFFE